VRATAKWVASGLAAATVGVGAIGVAASPALANGHAEFQPSGALAFGSQVVSTQSATLTETITNGADNDVNFLTFAAGAVTVTGANSADFSIVSNSCSGTTLLAHGTCSVSVSFTPTATGSRSADLHFVFTGGGQIDPPSPQDVALSGTGIPAPTPVAQLPVNGCVTAPKKLPTRGTRRLLKAGCITNSGTPVSLSVTGKLRGDVRIFRVFVRANGSTYIKTYGQRARIRIAWSAPATTGYSAYSQVKTYRT